MKSPPVYYALRKHVARSIRGLQYRKEFHSSGTPKEIVIGLHNQCTRSCAFCRFGLKKYSNEPPHKMPDSIIAKIIKELKSIDYTNSIGIGRYSEPMMDDRLESILLMMSAELPDCKIHFITNGDLATGEKLEALCGIPTLRRISMSVYDSEEQYIRFKNMVSECGENVHAKVRLDRKFAFEDFHVVNKIGELSVKPDYRLKEWGRSAEPGLLCTEPFRRMMINHDGSVPMCCNILDFAHEDYVMGNVNNESIMEIWSGERLSTIRNKMTKGGLRSLDACKKCDDYRFCVVTSITKAVSSSISYYF
ncbi:radical SAM/SPASM domain-containing protein [Candidatus Neomarinimicrobiota bacterium]